MRFAMLAATLGVGATGESRESLSGAAGEPLVGGLALVAQGPG